MLKNKKALWIALAVVFIVVLFLSKTTSVFKNKEVYQKLNQEDGLSYNILALEELVNKDTDQDGVLDWEESLWGTDPTKKETTPGTTDMTAINKLKAEQAESTGATKKTEEKAKPTQTDQLSRELFATVASLSQNGQIDEATIEELSSQLAEKIKNPDTKKIFLISEIKITEDVSAQAIEKYLTTIDSLYKANGGGSVTDILKEFLGDGENINTKAISKLTTAAKNLSTIINGMAKMTVPKNLASAHLNLVNTLEKLKENMEDIKLFDTDPIMAMSAIISYGKNIETLEIVTKQLGEAIKL